MLVALFLLIHVAGLAAYTVYIRKVALGGVNKYQLSALTQTAFYSVTLTLIAVGAIDVTFRLEPHQYGLIAVSAFCIATFNVLRVKALQHVEASVFQILFNLRLFLITILGTVFLNEHLPTLQVAGGFVIFASILVIGTRQRKLHFEKGMEWGLFVAVYFSLHALLEKHNVSTIGLGSYMFWVGLMTLIIGWILVPITRKKRDSWRSVLRPEMLGAILFPVLSGWTYVAALNLTQLAIVNYVSGLSVIAAVAAGVIFLNEKEHLSKKLIATAMAVIGLTLILLGNL